MSTVAEPTLITPEDLLRMPDGNRYELVNGQLVEQNMSASASWVGVQTNQRVSAFVTAQNLGWPFQSDTTYQCFPDDPAQVRRPDGSFVRKGRLSRSQFEYGHVRIAPDWLLEVVSPNDLATEIDEKVEAFLRAGVRLIWVANPELRTVHIFRADGTTARLHASDELEGEDVIPGFRCPVADIFPTEEQLKSLT